MKGRAYPGQKKFGYKSVRHSLILSLKYGDSPLVNIQKIAEKSNVTVEKQRTTMIF